MHGLSPALQSLLSFTVSVMVLAALVLLWRRSRSAWLVVAVIGDTVDLLLRALLVARPAFVAATPVLFSLWTLTALACAVGLLGYAIETTTRRAP